MKIYDVFKQIQETFVSCSVEKINLTLDHKHDAVKFTYFMYMHVKWNSEHAELINKRLPPTLWMKNIAIYQKVDANNERVQS